MKTPKEKAFELFNLFDKYPQDIWVSKEYALTCVDEILPQVHTSIEKTYWINVYKEITKL